MRGQPVHGHGVARLVDGRGLQVPTGLDVALLGRTGYDLHQSLVDVLHVQHRAILPGGQNGSLV